MTGQVIWHPRWRQNSPWSGGGGGRGCQAWLGAVTQALSSCRQTHYSLLGTTSVAWPAAHTTPNTPTSPSFLVSAPPQPSSAHLMGPQPQARHGIFHPWSWGHLEAAGRLSLQLWNRQSLSPESGLSGSTGAAWAQPRGRAHFTSGRQMESLGRRSTDPHCLWPLQSSLSPASPIIPYRRNALHSHRYRLPSH